VIALHVSFAADVRGFLNDFQNLIVEQEVITRSLIQEKCNRAHIYSDHVKHIKSLPRSWRVIVGCLGRSQTR
jgi:hypothetical protein